MKQDPQNLILDLALPPSVSQPRRFFIRVLKGYGQMALDEEMGATARARFVAEHATGCIYELATDAEPISIAGTQGRETFVALAPKAWWRSTNSPTYFVFSGETGDELGEGGTSREAAIESASALVNRIGPSRFSAVLDCCVASFGYSPRYDDAREGANVKRNRIAEANALQMLRARL